jgi:hypothetical protein
MNVILAIDAVCGPDLRDLDFGLASKVSASVKIREEYVGNPIGDCL